MVKNTASKIYSYTAIFAAMFLVSLVIIASCGPYNNLLIREDPPLQRSKPPVDAFLVIVVDSTILPEKCDPPTKNCKSVIGTLPPIETRKTGSGMLVWHEGRSFVLTAEHVCTEESPTHFVHPDPTLEVRIKLSSSEKIHVVGVDGVKHDADIVALNADLDLCALKVKTLKSNPVALSPVPPSIGDSVHSIAAPYGLGGESLSLIFNGRYSGAKKGRHYYTIPTRPGSSGAIVLNDRWQAIGSLHTAFVPLENVGIGAGWQDLRLFMESIKSH